MDETLPLVSWTASFAVVPPSRSTWKDLRGDKILLPQSALEQLLAASTSSPVPSSAAFNAFAPAFAPYNPYESDTGRRIGMLYQETSQQLPNPLMFRLVNPKNGHVVYAGIREFSAEEGEMALGPFLMEALGIQESEFNSEELPGNTIDLTSEDDHAPLRVTVHAKQLPKGTYVRLRPLEAGYNPDDWKSLLERQLRESFTTLTRDTILSVRGIKGEQFRFLVDKFEPEGDGICVVDTDLEVDIEALNEEQARETLRQMMAKAEPGSGSGSSRGGEIDIWSKIEGQVLPGEYVDYELPSWDRSNPITIEISGLDQPELLDLFVSPKSSRQRSSPRDSEHVFGDFSSGQNGTKSISIQPTNTALEEAERLLISIHGYTTASTPDVNTAPITYTLTARSLPSSGPTNTQLDSPGVENRDAEDEQCKNCLQWVPTRTMILHQNFCLRNNILCPKCRGVFKKFSEAWQSHWHCEFDDEFGDSPSSKSKHDAIFHTTHHCPACDYVAASLVELALHRTSVCPGKLILCQFCHLEVPQEGDPSTPSAELLLTGLTAHELADGARTTECHLCDKIVRMRDMSAHLKYHELDKVSRVKPEICRNINCGRTLHGVGPRGAVRAGTAMGQGPGNDLGLCSLCFGPLYVSMHDPEGKALRRRIERRYLGQMMTGCGKKWCANEWCRTGRANLGLEAKGASAQAVLPLVKPLLDAVATPHAEIYFCVDEGSQRRRKLAEMIASEHVWDLEWCVAGCEAGSGDVDKAREWLQNWAPMK